MSLESPSLAPRPVPRWLHPALWIIASLLLALIQIPLAGYQLGVGNQGIQIAFLERLHNRELFSSDPMVVKTLATYPSYFFHLLAKLLAFVDLQNLYLALHVLTTTAVFASVMVLSRALTKTPWAAIPAVLILLAGHHEALAGESLYSLGFTHTWAVFPLSLFALALFFRDRLIPAFVLAGIIFNFHALEAGHLILLMGFASLFDLRRRGIKPLAAACGLFFVAAAPTILTLLLQRQHLTADESALWLQLMHIRSADHSFPSSWWQEGVSSIPVFLCVLALGALSLGFRLPARTKRKTLLIVAAAALLFIVGIVLTEFRPTALVIRAQFFRASRLLFILAIILTSHGIASSFRLLLSRKRRLALPLATLECLSALISLACLALPPLLPALPIAVLLALVAALASGRLAWHQALFAGGTLLLCIIATQNIGFLVPGISRDYPLTAFLTTLRSRQLPDPRLWLAGITLTGIALSLYSVTTRRSRKVAYPALAGGILAGILALLLVIPVVRKNAEPDSAWADAQLWAAANTPKSALFLTRAQESGFRILSQRGIVGEWRDGTQLYFNQRFAADWWKLMNDLQPGIVIAADGKSLISRGKPLDQLDDEEIVKVAQANKADYVVLPRNDAHYMKKVFQNKQWTIFQAKIDESGAIAGDVALPEENKFLLQTANPNIEKYRKSDLQITIVDPEGKPLSSAAYTLKQKTSSFGFGASLPFFKRPDVDTKVDYKPPAVTPAELDRFKEVFNYSVIPFSGQWRFLEPVEKKIIWDDLDQYIAFCTANNVRPEFRFLAGHAPAWFKGKLTNDQKDILLKHAADLAARYGTKILDWQVTSEDVGLKEIGFLDYDPASRKKKVADFFDKLRKTLPNAHLGIADDARFYSPRQGTAATDDMLRGLKTIKDLKSYGITVDYFALQAKHPLGLWASGKSIYEVLDAYAKEGLRIHVTEFGVAVGDRIEGTVRQDTWTPQAQAEYYERFFTICFSHPAVDTINVMGLSPNIWLPGQGLLNPDGSPTPAFLRLKELITTKWRTNATGQTDSAGMIALRAFHGTYELSLTSAGKTATLPLTLQPPSPNGEAAGTYRFVFNPSTGALTPAIDGAH